MCSCSGCSNSDCSCSGNSSGCGNCSRCYCSGGSSGDLSLNLRRRESKRIQKQESLLILSSQFSSSRGYLLVLSCLHGDGGLEGKYLIQGSSVKAMFVV